MNTDITLNQPRKSGPAPAGALDSKDHAPSEASVVRYEGANEPRVPVGIVVAIIAVLIAAVCWAFKFAHSQ